MGEKPPFRFLLCCVCRASAPELQDLHGHRFCNGQSGLGDVIMTVAAERRVVEFLSLFDTDALDFGKLRSCLAPDARYLHRVRHAEPLSGIDAIEQELRGQFSRYKDCSCTIHSIASNATRVFTERTDEVTMRHDGKRVAVLVCGVFDVNEESRITYWREYWDMQDILTQTGNVGT
jgi:limonene-1,2-epoxide hydrolase